MITDPSWLYSTIAQSSAAIVAIVGGSITASVLMLTAEKRSLNNQKKGTEARLETLRSEKEKLSKELDANEVKIFIEFIIYELISAEKLPSLGNMMQNHPETHNLNLEILRKEYEVLTNKVIKAKNFIEQHLNLINPLKPTTFDKWVRDNTLSISAYDYEILERTYDKVVDQKQESLSVFDRLTVPSNPLKMRVPNRTSIAEEQEFTSIRERFHNVKYELPALEKEVSSIDSRISTFSYPQYLGWGLFTLAFLALFGIIIPVLAITYQVFFTWAKVSTTVLFCLGIAIVFVYIAFQIRTLIRRKT